MAPPMSPGRPYPMPAHRRSPADLLLGLAAVAALAALTAGVPFALVTVFGLPVPHGVPGLSALSRPLDVFAILKALSVLVWLAWIQLVGCVIAEVRAAVRNAGMPARVPLAGGTQALVHRLVTTALLLFAATAALSPAFTARGPAAAAPPSAAAAAHRPAATARPHAVPALPPRSVGQPQVAPAGGAGTGRTGPPGTRPHGTPKIYVVQPPAGRFHESLWEIAQKFLGDGRRYREIYELNSGRVQPDGSRLTIASLIRPGWVLQLPADAHGMGIEMAHAPAAAGMEPAIPAAAGDIAGQDGSAWETVVIEAAAVSHGPAVSHRAVSRPAPGGTRPGRLAGSAAGQPAGGLSYPRELAAASLLASGLLAALGRRRREQLWQRAFGRRVVGPDGAAALAEAALRSAAQEPSARLLDTGLRYLSHALARSGRTPPTVFAAHLSPANLDLWVAPADRRAPKPWTAVGDGQVWRLPAAALDRIPAAQAGSAAALFPGLVSLGTDHAGRVLANLEAAHGVIALTGPGDIVTAALSGIVLELATSRWSDGMQLTLAGFGSDLVRLAPDRITAVATLGEALPGLSARAAAVTDALAASGIGSVLAGRSEGLDPGAWTPHFLISAVPPTPLECRQLLSLARSSHAAAAGYLIAGDVPGAAWTWEVTPEGRLLAGGLGFDVQAQLVPGRQRAAVVDLFDAAARTEGVPLSVPPAGAVPREHLESGATPPVRITLLGPVRVAAPGPVQPGEAGLLTEMLVYLAAHPGGVPRSALRAAIWPGGVSAADCDAALDRASAWLGADSIGRPHLAADLAGRLRFGSGVQVDWQVFQALTGHAALAPPGSAPEAGYLARALEQVSGPFLDGRDMARYAWLATEGLEYEVGARIADAAHRLSALRRDAGDAGGAMAAARAGLRLAGGDELLWRDLLQGAEATGQPDVLHAVVAEVCDWATLDKAEPWMAPETEALIDELYPSWRSAVG